VDHRSDIYSIGVTLYELLTGRKPFDGATEYLIMTGHLSQEARFPSELNTAIPHGLSLSIMKSLAKSPADRFQTAGEFLQALTSMSLDQQMTLETMAIQQDPRLPSANPAPANPAFGNPAPFQPVKPSSSGSPASKPSYGTASPGGPFDASLLDSVSRELAVFIGPIAKLVVRRAAGQCTSVDDLYSKVAAEIDSDRDRGVFLSKKKKRV
jgi:serine/threonine-protein kinase